MSSNTVCHSALNAESIHNNWLKGYKINRIFTTYSIELLNTNIFAMKQIIYFAAFIFIASCTKKEQLSEDYLSKLDQYKYEKMDSRKKGYLRLVALTPLNDSANIFGKYKKNNLLLKIETLPDTIGFLVYKDSILNFQANSDINVKSANDLLISSVDLTFDQYSSSQKLFHEHINWQIITRAKKHYLRVWDSLNPEIEDFKGFSYFKPTADFILDGDFEYYDAKKTEKVKSKLGVRTSTNFIGKVSFNYKNKRYSLGVGENGFLMVGDETNDKETYGGGRYVYLDLPEINGKTTLDFNKLYNPPCAYNEFTTCLYPLRQNHLPFAITAGETMERIQ